MSTVVRLYDSIDRFEETAKQLCDRHYKEEKSHKRKGKRFFDKGDQDHAVSSIMQGTYLEHIHVVLLLTILLWRLVNVEKDIHCCMRDLFF